jgi:hypothetical protein
MTPSQTQPPDKFFALTEMINIDYVEKRLKLDGTMTHLDPENGLAILRAAEQKQGCDRNEH